MINPDEFFVVCKFTSGEQVMAVLRNEDMEFIELEYPMVIRTHPNFESQREQITAHPFCVFSDEKSFVIDKRNILFVKKLHHVFVPHYMRIVEEHEQTVFTAKEQPRAEDLQWEDEEVMLTDSENAKKAIAQLKAIFGVDEPEEREESRIVNFVKGNDTIN